MTKTTRRLIYLGAFTVFDLTDILCYGIGCLLVWGVPFLLRRIYRSLAQQSGHQRRRQDVADFEVSEALAARR